MEKSQKNALQIVRDHKQIDYKLIRKDKYNVASL